MKFKTTKFNSEGLFKLFTKISTHENFNPRKFQPTKITRYTVRCLFITCDITRWTLTLHGWLGNFETVLLAHSVDICCWSWWAKTLKSYISGIGSFTIILHDIAIILKSQKFSEWKQAHERMEPSKTNQTRWEWHHNILSTIPRSCANYALC